MMKRSLFALIASCMMISSLSQAQELSSRDEQKVISTARRLFSNKKFPEAMNEYKKITPRSDRYLLIVEEKAWAYMQMDQMDKALAEVRTLTSPALAGLVGTEPYLLQALAQLKLCDYDAVFKTLKDFKENKRQQVEAVQLLAKNKRNNVSRQALEKWVNNDLNWKKIGPEISQMPQMFYLDKKMIQAAQQKNFVAMESRLQQLAENENNENFRILQKLSLVEVESVQRVHMESDFNGKQGEQLERGKYDLVFKDSNEVWIDELDSYQAKVHRCQRKSGRTM